MASTIDRLWMSTKEFIGIAPVQQSSKEQLIQEGDGWRSTEGALERYQQREALRAAQKEAERIADLNHPAITAEMRDRANAYMNSRREQLISEGLPPSDAWTEAAWDTRQRLNQQLEASIAELQKEEAASRAHAAELVNPVPGETDAQRIGRGQGEADYLANADHIQEEIGVLRDSIQKVHDSPEVEKEQPNESAYAAGLRAKLAEQGIRNPYPEPEHETTLIDEVKEAFRDNDIPEEYAQLAVDAADLEDKTPAEREAFYNSILDARADENLEALGLNSWEDSIQAAAMQGKAEDRQAEEVARLIAKTRSTPEQQFIAGMSPEERSHALRGAEELARNARVRPGTDDEAAHESVQQTAAKLRRGMENRQTVKKEQDQQANATEPIAVKPKPTVFETVSGRLADGWDRLKASLRNDAVTPKADQPKVDAKQVESSANVLRQGISESVRRNQIAVQEIRNHPAVRSDLRARWEMVKADFTARFRTDYFSKSHEEARAERIGKSLDKLSGKRIDKLQTELIALDHSLGSVKNLNITPANAHLRLSHKQQKEFLRVGEIGEELKALSPNAERIAEIHARWNAGTLTARNSVEQSAEIAPQKTVAKVAEPQKEIAIRAEDKAEIERMEANRQRAISVVKEIRQLVPVDGYKSESAKIMAKNIWEQLHEPGRTRLELSAKYDGDDIASARATHQKAIDLNGSSIDAIRSAGIPVDTGKASIRMGKSEGVSEGFEATPNSPGQRIALG